MTIDITRQERSKMTKEEKRVQDMALYFHKAGFKILGIQGNLFNMYQFEINASIKDMTPVKLLKALQNIINPAQYPINGLEFSESGTMIRLTIIAED